MEKQIMPDPVDFEIINIEPINDYISECEIKVFYHGRNRNGSYISKAVGNRIANSLPRTPIVALYNEEIDDYEDHGEEITINSKGVKFEKKTIPYGAVDKDTPVVWKKFWDDLGVEREYLVVRGYLWTGRYPHLKQVIEKPKGQSMEFFEESVDGNWAKFDNEEQEIFIFNEADISALCILGDDVEPCFEDASIGSPEILYSLKKDEFKQEFNTFMFELDQALNKENSTEGGMAVSKNKDKNFVEESVVEEPIVEELVEEPTLEESTIEEPILEEPVVEDEFTEEESVVEEEEEPVVNEEFTKLQTEYELIKTELEDLKTKYAALVEEKEGRELEAKKEICEDFAVLGEEVMKDFEENLADYTVEDLEKELSAIAFKKGISFSLLEQDNKVITAAPIKNTEDVPAWVKVVKKKETEY